MPQPRTSAEIRNTPKKTLITAHHAGEEEKRVKEKNKGKREKNASHIESSVL